MFFFPTYLLIPSNVSLCSPICPTPSLLITALTHKYSPLPAADDIPAPPFSTLARTTTATTATTTTTTTTATTNVMMTSPLL